MKQCIFVVAFISWIATGLMAQTNFTLLNEGNEFINEISYEVMPEGFIWVNQNTLRPLEAVENYATMLGVGENMELRHSKYWKDETLGMEHNRYQLYYKDVPVEGAEFSEHSRDGWVELLNGKIVEGLSFNLQGINTKEEALAAAMEQIGATEYLWQNAEAEAALRDATNDPTATYRPVGELVIALTGDGTVTPANYKLAWKFEIGTTKPEADNNEYFVDAYTGNIVNKRSTAKNNGPANTIYNGTQQIDTEWFGGFSNRFNLIANDGGRYIETRYGTFNPGTIFEMAGGLPWDRDDVWTIDERATTVHWGVTKAYDYFQQIHGRAGSNGNHARIHIWANSNNNNSAFNGRTRNDIDDLEFGSVLNGGYLGSLDICAHEYTHAVIDRTSRLIYSNESGALNESFADIFGMMTERWQNGGSLNNWIFGDQVQGNDFRSFSNPAQFNYTIGGTTSAYPNQFRGAGWYFGTGDQGGVHFNSSVQNLWFFLLSQGQNIAGQNIVGIGADRASRIAYYCMVNILQSSAQYADARAGSLAAARMLYGQCSNEEFQAARAWAAVGVGNRPTSIVCVPQGIRPCHENLPISITARNLEPITGNFIWRAVPSTWGVSFSGTNNRTITINSTPNNRRSRIASSAPLRAEARDVNGSLQFSSSLVQVMYCEFEGPKSARLKEKEESPIKVFPVPALNYVVFELLDGSAEIGDNLSLQIFGLDGKVLIDKPIVFEPSIVIDISALPAALYQYRIRNNNTTFNGKFIKSE